MTNQQPQEQNAVGMFGPAHALLILIYMSLLRGPHSSPMRLYLISITLS
jgi:hypothetical protein